MPVQDFRAQTFDVTRVVLAGKDIGKHVYHRLYAIENCVRVVIHSVLSAQIGPSWWATAVDAAISRKAARFRANYAKQPWHSSPGTHGIFYVDLSNLNEIIRANRHLFLPAIPDVDAWIARIEQARLPRNIVAHMNWPSRTDRKRLEVLQSDLEHLMTTVATVVAIQVPK